MSRNTLAPLACCSVLGAFLASSFACGSGTTAATGGAGASSSGVASPGSSGGPGASSGVTPPATNDDGLLPSDAKWRTTSEWYRAIDTAPVAAHSGDMLGALPNWGISRLQIDFSFVLLNGAGVTPVTITGLGDETDDVPVPIPANGYIEGEHAYNACPAGDDCHVLVIDSAQKRLWEVFAAHKPGATWQASGIALWKLDTAYPRTARGQGCTSADAAGLAITPGLIGFRETKRGEIKHALRFAIPNPNIRSGVNDNHNVAYPATHGTRAATSATGLPYGARLRLKGSISDKDARIKSEAARTIFHALQKYGMILADGGNVPLMAESDRVYRDADSAEKGWTDFLGPRDLEAFMPSDFEVVGIPKAGPEAATGAASDYYSTKAEYEAQLKQPLGCVAVVQP